MNSETELNECCREWRRLAAVEGDAICRRDWQLVLDCQKALRMLQPRLLRCSETNAPAAKTNFQAAVSEMIDLERRNLDLLNTLQQSAALKKQRLEQTQQNLRRVQHSYAPAPAAAWSSFS